MFYMGSEFVIVQEDAEVIILFFTSKGLAACFSPTASPSVA